MLCSQCGARIEEDRPEGAAVCPACGFALVEVIGPPAAGATGQSAPAATRPGGAAAPLTGRQAYNAVSDLATGVNIRKKDNLYQALFILASIPLGVLVGLCVSASPEGAVVGGFCGLLFGLFGSGIFLMIYRAVQHARGRHD